MDHHTLSYGSCVVPTASQGEGSVSWALGGSEPVQLYVEGARYTVEKNGEWEFLRSDPKLSPKKDEFSLSKSRTTAGVGLRFVTSSPSVTLCFRYNAYDRRRRSVIGVSRNGRSFDRTEIPLDAKTTILHIKADVGPEDRVEYRVVLPPWANPILTDLSLPVGHKLGAFTPPRRGAYLALGDSITHGSGLEASYEGYPWQVAQALSLELFNLGSGGARVAPTLARSTADWRPESVSLITTLFGYNDWMSGGKTAAEFKEDYTQLLSLIRRRHPHAPLVCLNLLQTSKVVSCRSGLPVDGFRSAIREVVADRRSMGDANIFVAPSETWTTGAPIHVPDGVHPGPEGSSLVASHLISF
eukprot:CAMPEP_0119121572 /NCGR_PEP_ID=MMETSP1310-20130426/2141_1 /TAXON_ID=464262 /ORGANISM="Genus nov. species nov., Strain RCC2339" /LENGTH=355 /DNA_ID=CAMNT_0007111143 /DNA_START=245 /DNA_END=1309 /DNA_ORIENTATION=+